MRISVAMATFNGALYVEEQVASILRGARVPDEIVIADDASTDETLTLARRAFRDNSTSGTTLRVLEGAQALGVAANFERAILSCEGDLIALSDQDDIWHEDRLAAAIPSFEKNAGLALQHSDARLVDSAGEPLGVSLLEALTVSPGERRALRDGNAFPAYIRRNLATGATVLMRRDLARLATPFPAGWVHDEWLAIVAAAAGSIELIESQLIDYRQHSDNQIGVKPPTLGYRVSRMLEPRNDRFERLAQRSRVLADRLRQLAVPPEVLALAEDKARFEARRARLPRARALRVPIVLGEWRAGSYRRLSSQGNLDVVRDLLQPA